ncbi:MAG: hypothetical protein KatS3mg059_1811 [Thermomicrobiales bacterium]|nr:MAG: hypothetical protein KatS3mg059_1811 [Thermomicrobiales bacterium]
MTRDGIWRTVWILGASDPEMYYIERMLVGAGQHVMHALDGTGSRVSGASAYSISAPLPWELDAFRVVLVECAYDDAVMTECIDRGLWSHLVWIDHHRDGDYGYGKPPEQFWEASSIGQVYRALMLLGIMREPVRHEWRLAAAADHCLAAAYAGRCPGIDPDELAEWRIRQRARYQRVEPQVLRARVNDAIQALRAAPMIELAPGIAVRDMRSLEVPELPEAAARTGDCFVARIREPRSGRTKIVCQAGTPDQIRAFMHIWAVRMGLSGVYGDPERGFAGGYIVE